MEDIDKKTSKSPLHHKKKSSRSKSKLPSKYSLSRRRKKKLSSKIISQNSGDNVSCFPIPFADFFCGCTKDCGKDKNKIKKMSSKKLLKNKRSKLDSKISGTSNSKEGSDEKLLHILTNLESNVKNKDIKPGLTEQLDVNKLKLNSSLKQLLANVKFSSIFGCSNVPKTLSQIKILLDTNPSLKSQLKHILGDNLKNENLKPIADLLASGGKISGTEIDGLLSGNTDISKITLKTDSDSVSLKSTGLSKKTRAGGKPSNCTKSPRSKKERKEGSSKDNKNSESQTSIFRKLFSSVVRPKAGKMARKKSSSIESNKTSKKISKGIPLKEEYIKDEKINNMKRKYEEWYKRSPDDVRERFKWDDYVKVKLYLNRPKENLASNDIKKEEMLNLWLRKFSNEINKITDDQSFKGAKGAGEGNSSEIALNRVDSKEMLNTGGGDVVVRLNSLINELIKGIDKGEDKGAEAVESSDKLLPQHPECSKNEQPPADKRSGSLLKCNEMTDELNLYQMMCESFVKKLSKHKSKDSDHMFGSHLNPNVPWPNKDFQVFCVPTIETGGYYDLTQDSDSLTVDSEDSKGKGTNENSCDWCSIDKSGRISSDDIRRYSNCHLSSAISINNSFGTSESKLNENFDSKEVEKCHESKCQAQKRVSFEDETNYKCDFSQEYEDSETGESDNIRQNILLKKKMFSSNKPFAGISRTCENSSTAGVPLTTSSSDMDDFIQHLEQTSDAKYPVGIDSLTFIKKHKCELVEILKYLVTLAVQNPHLFQYKDSESLIENSVTSKECIGIQCKLSEEFYESDLFLNKNITKYKDDGFIAKSRSETVTKKVQSASDSLATYNFKLTSTSSDSGVHSKSSECSHPRHFLSLPDVLEGASVVIRCPSTRIDNDSTETFNQNDDRNESSESNQLISCLSTSVSCQASKTPDIDNLSQISSDDTNGNILSTEIKKNLMKPCSEKSRSSEMANSNVDVEESKIVRSRIQKILNKIRVKEAKK